MDLSRNEETPSRPQEVLDGRSEISWVNSSSEQRSSSGQGNEWSNGGGDTKGKGSVLKKLEKVEFMSEALSKSERDVVEFRVDKAGTRVLVLRRDLT